MRRRYVYRQIDGQIQALEVSADFESTRGFSAPVSDLYMDGVRATDGTDIGSRAKRRQYMEANQLADMDDFKGVWAKEQAKREAERQGLSSKQERVDAVREAIQRLKAGRR